MLPKIFKNLRNFLGSKISDPGNNMCLSSGLVLRTEQLLHVVINIVLLCVWMYVCVSLRILRCIFFLIQVLAVLQKICKRGMLSSHHVCNTAEILEQLKGSQT